MKLGYDESISVPEIDIQKYAFKWSKKLLIKVKKKVKLSP
jgi:hypothetical protein